MMQNILVIDDEKDMCWSLSNILIEEGFNVITALMGVEGIRKVDKKRPDLVLLDLRLPDMDGIKVLQKIKRIDDSIPVIMLSAFGEVKSVVRAMKAGACEYITKPFDNEEVIILIKKAFREKKLQREVKVLRQRLDREVEVVELLGESAEIKSVKQQATKVAPTNLSVIIQGESGTGKEMIARHIHANSRRKTMPFITIDCGTLPEALIESELFGHEEGAFTGANKEKLGQFELADGGTLFLDEIGNLPEFAQAKLLRALQEKEVQHIGGETAIKVDIRILVASNLILEEAVKSGKFRNDLFHRLNEFSIKIPPLRERVIDIALLAESFLVDANRELHKQVKVISKEALDLLKKHDWTGNVRELKNAITRAVLLAEDDIQPDHLPQVILRDAGFNKTLKVTRKTSLKEVSKKAAEPIEKELIMEALKKAKNRKEDAVKILGISRKTLYNKMQKFGIF